MRDDQKFQNLKKKMVEENDQKYGEEVRQRWGEKAFTQSNQKFMGLTKTQYYEAMALNKKFKETLIQAFEIGDPKSVQAKKAVELHKQWLLNFWPTYSPEAHLGLAQMYIDDERFHHYFNDSHELVTFFRDAVKAGL